MKNRIITLIVFGLLSWNLSAQSHTWQWAKSAGGSASENCRSICTDTAGNIYVAGSFQSTSITLGNITLTSNGNYDMFVAKYDANGNILWAKNAGSTSLEYGIGVAVDQAGNVIVAGYFLGTSITFGNTTLINGGKYDLYIVKYDPMGNVIWAKSYGKALDDYATGLVVDGNNNIIITGMYYSPRIVFDNQTLFHADSSIYNPDIFTVKCDPNGNVLWAKSSGAEALDASNSICTDFDGNIFVTGSFSSLVMLADTYSLTNSTVGFGTDMFIIKYNAQGTVIWAKRCGGSKNDDASGICTDGVNIFATGTFQSLDFALGTSTLAVITTTGSFTTPEDMFLAKFDTDGNILWARAPGGPANRGWGVSCDLGGSVFATGTFQSPGITFGNTTFTTTGSLGDLFVTKYDPWGNVIWSEKASGNSTDNPRCIWAAYNGDILVSGNFQSAILACGTFSLSNTDATTNSSDLFLAKIKDLPTGIQENSNFVKLSAFPNPFLNEVTLESGAEVQAGSLYMNNSLGQTVKQITVSGTSFTITRDDLPTGIYILRLLQANKEPVVLKLIIAGE